MNISKIYDDELTEVKSGSCHNILRGRKGFYFLGNCEHNQFPFELGNNFNKNHVRGKVMNF